MAVDENGSLNRTDDSAVKNDSAAVDQNGAPRSTIPSDQNIQKMSVDHQPQKTSVQHKPQMGVFQQQKQSINGNGVMGQHDFQTQHQKMNGVDLRRNGGVVDEDEDGEGFKKEMRDLEEMLSKLNPMAEEFVPPSLSTNHGVVPISPGGEQFGIDAFNFVMQAGLNDGNFNRRVSISALFHFLNLVATGRQFSCLVYVKCYPYLKLGNFIIGSISCKNIY